MRAEFCPHAKVRYGMVIASSLAMVFMLDLVLVGIALGIPIGKYIGIHLSSGIMIATVSIDIGLDVRVRVSVGIGISIM